MSSQESEPIQRPLRRFGDRVLGFTLRYLATAISYTFLPVNHFYGACVGQFLWMVGGNIRRTTEINLAIAFPDRSDEERRTLAKQSLRELGKTITELGPLWCGSRRRVQNMIADVRGNAFVDTARDQGKGVIVLVPHFGAWEMAGLHLSIQYNIVSLYRPPRLRTIDYFSRTARERFGAQLVPTNVSGVRSLFKSLRKGDLTGILPDQDPGELGGVYAPFFGRETRTMVLASRLAAKTNSVVVVCLAERLPWGKGYCIHFIRVDPVISSKDEKEAATALNAAIESAIRINPAQYLWSYRRFRSSATGLTNPYKQNSTPSLKIHRPDGIDSVTPTDQPRRRAA